MPKSAGSLLLTLFFSLVFPSSSFSLTIFSSHYFLSCFSFRPCLTSQFYSVLRPLPSTSTFAFSDRSLLLSCRCTLFARAWHLANRLRRSDCTIVRWKRLRCTCSVTRPGASPSFAIRTVLRLLTILTRYVSIWSALVALIFLDFRQTLFGIRKDRTEYVLSIQEASDI